MKEAETPLVSGAQGMVKLVLDGDPNRGTGTETVWARKVENESDLYEVFNIPIWAYGIAAEDVVSARMDDDDRLHFVKVVRPSGILTVRVAGPRADEVALSNVKDLLGKNAIASENYSKTYMAYAMEKSTFMSIEADIDRLCDYETLFVEVSNEEES